MMGGGVSQADILVVRIIHWVLADFRTNLRTVSFAGLGFLSFYLAAKTRLYDERAASVRFSHPFSLLV